jgi:hypothetical protein
VKPYWPVRENFSPFRILGRNQKIIDLGRKGSIAYVEWIGPPVQLIDSYTENGSSPFDACFIHLLRRFQIKLPCPQEPSVLKSILTAPVGNLNLQ